MRPTHNDQLRRAALDLTPAPAVSIGARPITPKRPFPRPEQLAHRARAQGGMKAFLAMARAMQRLRE